MKLKFLHCKMIFIYTGRPSLFGQQETQFILNKTPCVFLRFWNLCKILWSLC